METRQKWQDLILAIEEKVITAKEDIEENKAHPNSYGAGYDSGYLQALRDIQELMENA